jgi:hypothetical protein
MSSIFEIYLLVAYLLFHMLTLWFVNTNNIAGKEDSSKARKEVKKN